MRFPFTIKRTKSIMNEREIYLFNKIVDSMFPYSANKAELIKRAKGTVYTCCSLIANDGARVPLKLFTTKPLPKSSKVGKHKTDFLKSDKSGVAYRIKEMDEVQEVYDSEMLARLWTPNTYFSYNKLLAQTLFHLLLTGDAYWYIVKTASKKPMAIHVMPPEHCQINEKTGEGENTPFREIDKYIFGKTEYPPENIVHFSLVNPKEDGWKQGMSPLEAVISDDKLMDQIKSLRNELAKTKPGTSFYIEWDKDAKVTPDQQKAIKTAIAEYRSGKQNFDETLAIPGGKLVPFPMIGADIPFQTDMAILREFIANAYKVPITKFMSASNRAERDTSNVEYYASAVTPVLIELQETLNSFYIPMFTDTKDQFFAFDDCIPDDEAVKMRIDTGYVNAGIRSINEIRYERNFGEGIDGGDDHYIASNLIPIGNVALQEQVRTAIAEVMKQFKKEG